MELVFLGLLILLMIVSLSSGFPVAFALPGSAIGAIGLAALCGYLFAGDPGAYFAQDGPVQWLTAGGHQLPQSVLASGTGYLDRDTVVCFYGHHAAAVEGCRGSVGRHGAIIRAGSGRTGHFRGLRRRAVSGNHRHPRRHRHRHGPDIAASDAAK